MKKVLISVLGNDYDVLTSSNLVNSYIKEHPHTEVSILAFKESKDLVGVISNVTKTYFIDKIEIENLYNNALFSDAFAVNNFFASIKECATTEWDTIINYSNDSISALLASMFKSEEFLGTRISSGGSAITTNKWSTYQNYACSGNKLDLISKVMTRQHIASVPFVMDEGNIKSNEEYSTIATQNFAKIRRSKTTTTNANIIGVDLTKSYSGKRIDIHTLFELVENLETSERFKSVLILSGSQEEKEIVNRLNEKFDNTLISINADLIALPSVFMNLDMLVTTNNNHLVIADIVDTKIVEVRPGSIEKRTPAAVNSDNFIIFQNDNDNIVGDISMVLNQVFETDLPVDSMESTNKTFHIINDDYGTLLTQTRGPLEIQSELRYHIERCFHYQLMGYPLNNELIKHIKDNTPKEDLHSFTTSVKDELTDTVKILLATLRSLKGVKQSKSNLNNFISYLDALIQKSKLDFITKAPIAMFEGRVENIQEETMEGNMKAIEENLFMLKNDLQLLTNIVTTLAETSDVKGITSTPSPHAEA